MGGPASGSSKENKLRHDVHEPMIGDRIRVKTRHWLRGNAEGVIEDRVGPDAYLILFDQVVEFRGFDGGSRLLLSMNDFQVIQEVKSGS